MTENLILALSHVRMSDLGEVGGKNASLGEMIGHLTEAGVCVPGGFATTASAYKNFLEQTGLTPKIKAHLDNLDIEDVRALATTGQAIRQLIEQAALPEALIVAIKTAYSQMAEPNNPDFAVAVRSSATAEDLPDASFAGQQETLLNVRGIAAVLAAVKIVFASLYNDRAIAYRAHHGFDQMDVALSVGIQYMVRSDCGASGVMFTVDTESGFDKVVMITGSYGLGEMVVQGAVNPDEFYVYKPNLKTHKPAIVRKTLGTKREQMIYGETGVKVIDVPEARAQQFCLDDSEITYLAEQAVIIENHYGRPMDIEWAKDGVTGDIVILQARPETVQSRRSTNRLERFALLGKSQIYAEGRSIGQRVGQGPAKIIKDSSQMDQINPGDVLVTDMTDPDWEPIMKRASAIVTNRGGRTCHAAIIARELGIPALVGCGDATKTIPYNHAVTVSCCEGDNGYVYQGLIPFEHKTIELDDLPEPSVKLMLNVGNPERAFAFQALPNSGVGLARLEFIISNTIGIHPRACLDFLNLHPDLQQKISAKISGYPNPIEYYIDRLVQGIASIACAFYPKPVIVRLSDFKSNEYANLLGGDIYEPQEENPMLGFRGASRYVSPEFRASFALECQAIKIVREMMGFGNVEIMIPFVRTVEEARQVINILKDNNLERGQAALRIIMMCELPVNALLAEEFLQYFDGFSIGSNDLTQLTLGLDRDSGLIAQSFDERNPAVRKLLKMAIEACRAEDKYIGICGQGPSDHPDFAQWLMSVGIESISLNPDSIVKTQLQLADIIPE